MQAVDKRDLVKQVCCFKVQGTLLGMDGKAEGLLGLGLGLEPFKFLGGSALVKFDDLFNQDAARPTGRGGARVLPADLLAVLL